MKYNELLDLVLEYVADRDAATISESKEDWFTEASLKDAKETRKKITELKDKLRHEDDEDALKVFEKYEKDLDDAIEFVDKDPQELSSKDFKIGVAYCASLIVAVSAACVFPVIGTAVATMIAFYVGTIAALIAVFINSMQFRHDEQSILELKKIRSKLARLADMKGIPKSQRQKLLDLCDRIDDADEEVTRKRSRDNNAALVAAVASR